MWDRDFPFLLGTWFLSHVTPCGLLVGQSNGKVLQALNKSLKSLIRLKKLFSSFFHLFAYPQYIKNFYNRTVVSRNGTGLNGEQLTLMYSLTVSVLAIGGLIGSLMVGMLVTRFGRWVNRRPHNIWCCLVILPGVVLLLPRVWWPPKCTVPHPSPHITFFFFFTSVNDLGHTLKKQLCCFVAFRLKTSLTNFSDCCCDERS